MPALGFRPLRVIAPLAVAAALAGCGSDAKQSAKATTPAAGSSTATFTCPLTATKIGSTIGSAGMVLISESQQVCEYATPLGDAVSAKTADPKQPIVDIGLLPAPIAALQATAKTEHPGATITPRPDLGRQTFTVTEKLDSGGRRVTILSDAGRTRGSWATAVAVPAGSGAAAKALKLAVAVYNIKT